MHKMTQKVCIIVLVVLMATVYMAQAARLQQLDKKALVEYLFSKRDCSELGGSCTRSRDCCGNPGSDYEGVAPRCDYGVGICVLRQ